MKRLVEAWKYGVVLPISAGIVGIGATCYLVAITLVWIATPSQAMAQTAPGTVLRNPSFITTCGGSPCTGTAPTLTTDGRTLVNGSGVRVRLCADSGQTLSGAGTLDVYFFDEDDSLWALVPSLAITVPAGASGDRCVVVLADHATTVPTGRVGVVPNAVTLSAGNLSVKVYVTVKKAP